MLKIKQNESFKRFILGLAVFLTVLTVFFFTSGGTTPYNYFTRLAHSFIHGRYWLTEELPWLSELIPSGDGRYFVAYPPMPAIIAIPFVAFFGINFPQQIISQLLGAGITVVTVAISWKLKKDKTLAIWSGILVGVGSIIWFLSSSGSAWYLGQISAAFFLSLAIYEAVSKKRPVVVGVLLGAAYLSRIQTILAIFFFIFVFDKKKFSNYLKLGVGILPFFLFNSFYNYARFGAVWDKGYVLIPGVLNEIWYSKGLFNITYIPKHLKVIFAGLPKITSTFPYIVPSWAGLAIWITTPAFIYSVFAPIKEKLVKASWVSIFLISLVIFSHGTTGFSQFGYRFAVDFYPLLIFLTIKGVAKSGLRWHHWLLLAIGVVVNTWGVIFINKFGWVSF